MRRPVALATLLLAMFAAGGAAGSPQSAKPEAPTTSPTVGEALSGFEQRAADAVRVATVRDVTTTLGAMDMEGRGTAQPGGERAARYLADEFARVGLEPGNGVNFFQPIKLTVDTLLPDTSVSVGSTALEFGSDFGIAEPASPLAMKPVSADLVFAGYGVVSPEIGRDDLAGLDVKGRIVIVLDGRPPGVDAAIWDRVSDERVVFARLIERGAAGFIVSYAGDQSRFGMIARFVSLRNVGLASPLPLPAVAARWAIELLAEKYAVPPSVLVSDAALDRIFAARGADVDGLRQRAAAGGFVSRDLRVMATIAPRVSHGAGTTSNVVGVVRGSDRTLAHEAVVITAHYDGFGKGADGTVYPGAADNAIGVAKMVAVAQALATQQPRPRRSVVFIATTGEEYGDLGAVYWLHRPTWPLATVTADINYDGSPLEAWSPLGFIFDYHLDYSDLAPIVTAAAAALNVDVIPDQTPEQNLFTRGDQYAFARAGIPSIFLSGGPADHPLITLARARRWMATVYHTPDDQLQADWNWDGVRTAAVVGLVTAIRVANQPQLPAWTAASPFQRPRNLR